MCAPQSLIGVVPASASPTGLGPALITVFALAFGTAAAVGALFAMQWYAARR
jgi:uncharacterized protein involved in exopolysaccharide biosynthesis